MRRQERRIERETGRREARCESSGAEWSSTLSKWKDMFGEGDMPRHKNPTGV